MTWSCQQEGYRGRSRGWDGARGWGHGAGHGSNREAEDIIQQEPQELLYNCIIVHQHHYHYW